MIHLYWFQRTKDPQAQVIIDGKPIYKDKWMYDQGIRIEHPNRVMLRDHSLLRMPYFPPEN